jgi:regulator of PEP synthase PpsR (kinase-PPPase family)
LGSLAILSGFMDDTHKALETVLKDTNLESELKKEIKSIEVKARSTFQKMLHLIDTKNEVEIKTNLEIQKSQFHIYEAKVG